MIELAVCAEMVFLNLPFVERVRRIHELGFAVEIWGWPGKDIAALAATGARFSSMTGYVHGNLVEADAAATMLRTAEDTLDVATSLGCPRLVVHPAEAHRRRRGAADVPCHPIHVAHRPADP